MHVETIAANEHFGTVMGVLRAVGAGDVAVPFCGWWKFVDGQPVEHWENVAGDAEAIAARMSLLN